MRLILKAIVLSILLFLGSVILACSNRENSEGNNSNQRSLSISDSNTDKFDIAKFERNRELWTSKNIQHYKMIVGAESFSVNFPEEVHVEVRNRRSVSIKSLSKSGRNATSTYVDFDTVQKLFDFIDEAVKGNAKSLYVGYDADFGFPSQIEVDRDGQYGNDDELLLKIRDFEVIGLYNYERSSNSIGRAYGCWEGAEGHVEEYAAG